MGPNHLAYSTAYLTLVFIVARIIVLFCWYSRIICCFNLFENVDNKKIGHKLKHKMAQSFFQLITHHSVISSHLLPRGTVL